MSHRLTGSLIAASFGLVYVVVNSGPLAGPWQLALRLLAALAFAAVAVATLRSRHLPDGTPEPGAGRGFGRAYWVVVVIEVVALVVGVRVVAGPLGHPEAGVAWVSLVVGLHFFALAVVFTARFFHVLGVLVTLCGLAGLVLAALDAGTAPIAVVAGVVPGVLLLSFAWWGVALHRSRS